MVSALNRAARGRVSPSSATTTRWPHGDTFGHSDGSCPRERSVGDNLGDWMFHCHVPGAPEERYGWNHSSLLAALAQGSDLSLAMRLPSHSYDVESLS